MENLKGKLLIHTKLTTTKIIITSIKKLIFHIKLKYYLDFFSFLKFSFQKNKKEKKMKTNTQMIIYTNILIILCLFCCLSNAASFEANEK